MINPVTVCMWGHFRRETYRHRLVEAGNGVVLTPPPVPPAGWAVPPSSIRSKRPGPHWECGQPHPVPAARAGHWEPGLFVSVSGHERKAPVRRVMEIDWATEREDIVEAVPPYVGVWLGQEFTRHAR
jgi:hypothetical protein